MISWRIEEAEFELKRGISDDGEIDVDSIYADKTERTEVEEGVWTHRAVFDNDTFKIDIVWKIEEGEDQEEEEEQEDIEKQIYNAMTGEHFVVSHMLDFMNLGTSPLMPLEEEEHERLHDSSEED